MIILVGSLLQNRRWVVSAFGKLEVPVFLAYLFEGMVEVGSELAEGIQLGFVHCMLIK